MAIGFDVTPLMRRRSGIGTYTDNLIRAIVASGSAPEIVLLSNRDPEPGCELPPGCRIPEDGHLPLRALWMQLRLPSLIDRLTLDLCHFPNYLAPLAARCPIVVTIHDMALFRMQEFFTWKKRLLTRSLIPHVARRADAIITVSDNSRREIIELLGVPREKVHRIYEAPGATFRVVTDPGTRRAVRERYRLPERYVLVVGTIEPRKNLRRLADAFDQMLDERPPLRDVRLVLAGERGWSCGRIIRRIERLKAAGRAIELGYVPLEDLPALYSMASVAAYPSLYEGFGLPLLEAMASGAPVLTSNRSSLAEIAGGAACQVDPESTDALARGLERILTDGALAEDLRARGREHVRRYSWEKAAGETIEVYRNVARAGLRCFRARREALPAPAMKGVLSRAILRALHYSDIYDFPLTPAEIHANLIGVRSSREEVEACLAASAAVRDRVAFSDGVVHLRGREGLVERRRLQGAATDRLIAENRRLLSRMARLPFVRLIAFSGGTSHKNSPSCHDIDLFVVTARGRIWATYASIVLLARLHGRRPVICANYLVDEDHLRLPQAGDLFTAYQMLHLRPMAGAETYSALLAANPWVLETFPNAAPDGKRDLMSRTGIGRRLSRSIEAVFRPVGGMAERVARAAFGPSLRRKGARARGQGFILGEGILKLHAKDNREPAIVRYRSRLEQEGLWEPSFGRLLGVEADATEPAPGPPPAETEPDPDPAPLASRVSP